MALLTAANSLTVYRGASKTLEITVKTSAGTAVKLQNVRILFSVKREPGVKPALIQKTSDSALEIEITKPNEGKARIYLEASDTVQLDPGTYTFDVWVFFTLTGKRYMVVKPATFEVLPGVTYVPVP